MAYWNLLDDPTVRRVVRNAANSVADMNQGIVDAEDMFQEGLILVATVPGIAEKAIVGDFGLVYGDVRESLYRRHIRTLDRRGELDARKYRTVSTEDHETEPEQTVMFDAGTGDYTEDAVKLLLPAVWDDSYAYGLPDRENAPERDMPKAAANKARANNHWAYIADIKTGWETTPLTRLERRALLLVYGVGYTHEQAAQFEGVDQSTVTRRINTAIRKIVARLNGAGIEEEN